MNIVDLTCTPYSFTNRPSGRTLTINLMSNGLMPPSFSTKILIENMQINPHETVLDLGAGNGYILGLKVSSASTSLAQLVGSYNFVGVVADGSGLAGNTRISSDGSATCAIETNGVLSEDESFTGIQQCPNLPNVLHATHLDPRIPTYRGKAYFVISGDIMMYFIFDTDGFFNAYGAGVRIM